MIINKLMNLMDGWLKSIVKKRVVGKLFIKCFLKRIFSCSSLKMHTRNRYFILFQRNDCFAQIF